MVKNPYKGKAAAERRHAKKRAVERYGVNLTETLYNKVILAIQNTGNKPKVKGIEAEYIGKTSNALTKWRITVDTRFETVCMTVVYDKDRHELRTVLPPKEAKA